MRRYLIVLILLVQKVFIAFPASLPRLVTFDDYVDAIYQRQNFEEDFESIKIALQEAYARPLHLNKISAESLAELGILSTSQIKNFFHHLATTGPLYSRYELQAIPGFDLTTIALLMPFVYVEERYHIASHNLQVPKIRSNYFLFRYTPPSNPAVVKSMHTLGYLDKYTAQIYFNDRNDITWCITTRKQAGESFCWDHATHRYGFNLWSVFILINNIKNIKSMMIGDYQIGYGQGLLLSGGYIQTGDTICPIIRSNNVGIRPYKGIRRIGWRGLSMTSNLGFIELTGFYASNNLDAALQLSDQNKPYADRIDRVGKYDTTANLAKKGTINEQLFGCTIRKEYDRNQTEVGINLLYNHYDIPIIVKEDVTDPYLLQQQLATSLFYRLLWKNWIIFGEGAFTFPNITTKRNAKAVITGSIISLSRYVDLAFALYYYAKGFYAPYGNPFKRYTTDHANEQGIYAGLTFTPLVTWQITTNGHFFTTLSPKPKLLIPSSGYRFTTRSHYRWSRITMLVVQHKLHKNPHHKPKASNGTDMSKVEHAIQNNLKCKIDHKFSNYWWTHLEIQYTRYTFLGQTHHGCAASSRQTWKVNKWKFSCQPILFRTKNHATSIYFYLPNPLYTRAQFSPYYGNGIAATWLVCWRPMAFVRLEIKYTFIYFFKELEKIKATNLNTPVEDKHDATIQLLIRF